MFDQSGVFERRIHWALSERPPWDQNGGKWYCIPAMDPNARLVRWKPNIHHLCERLLLTPIDKETAWKRIQSEKLKTSTGRIRLPWTPLQGRYKIYRECIEVINVFGDPCDALTLAIYRQYVSHRPDIYLDELFYYAVRDMNQRESGIGLTTSEWKNLAERMPFESWIRTKCLQHSV